MEKALTARVLITDLDNTLFDWFDVWYHSFGAMLAEIERVSGIDRSELIPEIREIHRRHGTSEYAFLIEEIPALQKKHGSLTFLNEYSSAIDAFRENRRKHLRLYPAVEVSLREVKASGAIIVAYTESMAFYTGYRMRKLGLDGPVDFLYSPEDHDIPSGLSPEQIRYYPAEHYQFQHTVHRHTPRGEIKPNPEILQTIIQEIGADTSECVYVGDSLFKDVAMAKDVGIADVYAKYGTSNLVEGYDLLRAVTHWTDDDVERERIIHERQVEPTTVLEHGFNELLAEFDFLPFNGGGNS